MDGVGAGQTVEKVDGVGAGQTVEKDSSSLTKSHGKSGWKVNGKRRFRSLQRKISGSTRSSEKVVLFFRTERSKRKFVFHFNTPRSNMTPRL